MGSEDSARLRHTCASWLVARILVMVAALGQSIIAQTTGGTSLHPAQQREPSDPQLTHRPPPQPKSVVISEGKIKLDIVVNDGVGRPVRDLQPWDLKILDNGQPRKILSFRAFGGAVLPDPPVEVILVIDTLNLPFQQVSFVRREIEEFLRQDGGRLKQPLTLVLLTDSGIRFQPRPSADGNAIASVVDGIKGSVSMINPAMGGDGYLERFQRSTRALNNIAQNEARKPGRKLLIWAGPGWPMLNRPSDGYSEREQRRNFDYIMALSTTLREARITAYSVAPGLAAGPNPLLYRKFLNPVRTYRDADFGNMALKVLVTQTGGKILGPDNDLAGQISRCIEDANAFYQISFDPLAAVHEDEYHDLKVVIDKPDLTVRTNSGYYNQPIQNTN